ncbi:MAG: glycosyl transferase family 51, partial [Deltaproteobacteria bacterium]
MKIFSVETPVYYDDGKSLIGVFFENEHRIYIKYKDIPKDFINALIAAEDKNFFRHFGIDPLSILRAAYVNFRAKKIIQGGSTLTQQTAKNLFKRKGRTFPAKFRELIQALKLEAHYSKEEILEFFTNQFYVSGTGRGLAIAAKYFFDKPVDQLSLLECAFIAGSVRAPNRYNPLIQPTEEKKKETLIRAVKRKNYVLRNMLKLGMISRSTYNRLIKESSPFKKGRIYYQLNVIMDFIREQLQTERFQKIFKDHGISNIATSGIKIYTTVNRDLQEASLRILRKHLSRLETKISGYDREKIQLRYSQMDISPVKEPKIGDFVFGKVEEKIDEGEKCGLLVRIGDTLGKVDYKGLMNMVIPYKKSKAGIWANPTERDVKEFLSQIEVGDLVYVYIRGKNPKDNFFLLDLEQKPEIQGGVIVSRNGKILAMVGGFENIYFNRAVEAQRQMGSIFKPLVFTAALQLGWNLLDPLENRRDVFVFQDQFYFPRPDHESPYKKVSLAWAGVKSENVASVWLLYHLCDKLSFSQFKKVAQLVDLAPRKNESYYSFQRRVRDSWGIIITEEDLREVAFEIAKEECITDLIFQGRTKEAEALRFLKYGKGFDEYRETLLQEREALDLQQIKPSLLKEYEIKDNILKNNFIRFLQLKSRMMDEWESLD